MRGRKGEYKKEIAEYTRRGFQRLKIDGAYYEIADAPPLDKKLKHDIDVVVDRIVVRKDIAARLADSFETALDLSGGLAVVEFADAKARREARADAGLGECLHALRAGAHRLLVEIRLSGVRLHDLRKSSRGCSPSTIPSAPVRPAAASAASRRSTPISSCPIRS